MSVFYWPVFQSLESHLETVIDEVVTLVVNVVSGPCLSGSNFLVATFSSKLLIPSFMFLHVEAKRENVTPDPPWPLLGAEAMFSEFVTGDSEYLFCCSLMAAYFFRDCFSSWSVFTGNIVIRYMNFFNRVMARRHLHFNWRMFLLQR